MSNIKLAISLFSFGSLYLKKQLDLEGTIRTAAELGAEGYEIVAAQMVPNYPYVDDDFIRFVERCRDKYGIGPICYAANRDRGLLRYRDLTEDELVSRAVNDIVSANKLGCKVMREQPLLSPKGLQRLVPYAESYDVRVGIELQNPESPITPMTLEYLSAIEEADSPYLGFIPDLGCFATGPNKPVWDRARAMGATEEMLAKCADLRYQDLTMEELEKAMEAEIKVCPSLLETIHSIYGFVKFRRSCSPELEGLKRIMPHCFEFHGKCYYIDESLRECSIPYDEIIPVIASSDFDGYVVTEFENEGNYDVLEQTGRHIKMMKELLARR